MNEFARAHISKGENFDFTVVVVIYFVLPCPWRPQTPTAQKAAAKVISTYDQEGTKGNGQQQRGIREFSEGLGRVEKVKPGVFLFILILGADLGLAGPPFATAQHQAMKQPSNQASSMTGTLQQEARGYMHLWSSLTTCVDLNQHWQGTRTVDVQ